MKKLVTSLALVFAMLGLGLGVFAGCGNKDEFKNAEIVNDPTEIQGFIETANYFDGFTTQVVANGRTIMDAAYVEKVVDKKTVVEAKIVMDIPAEMGNGIGVSMKIYVTGGKLYIDAGQTKAVTDFDVQNETFAGAFEQLGWFVEEFPAGIMEQILTAEDSTLKKIVDETNGVVKYQGSMSMTEEGQSVSYTLTGHFQKNEAEEYDITYVNLAANTQGQSMNITVRSATSVDFGGVNFESGWETV